MYNYDFTYYLVPVSYNIASIFYDYSDEEWEGYIGQILTGDQRWSLGNAMKLESGMRFRNIWIPADASFSEVKITFRPNSVPIYEQVNTKFQLQDAKVAQQFEPDETGDCYADYIARSRLTNTVTWELLPTDWQNNIDTESPDLSSLFTEWVARYGAVKRANIVVFWGDKDGLTPAPPSGQSNIAGANRDYVSINMKFTSEEEKVVPFERNDWPILDKHISDFKINLEDKEIFNDVRYIVPHTGYRVDYTQTPPVNVPTDTIKIWHDIPSEVKYGRRTKKISWHPDMGNLYDVCEFALEHYKDPILQGRVEIKGADSERILRCLNTRISDIYGIDSDQAELTGDFWVNSKSLSMKAGGAPVMTVEVERFRDLSVFKIFEIDIDEIDGEAVIG